MDAKTISASMSLVYDLPIVSAGPDTTFCNLNNSIGQLEGFSPTLNQDGSGYFYGIEATHLMPYQLTVNLIRQFQEQAFSMLSTHTQMPKLYVQTLIRFR